MTTLDPTDLAATTLEDLFVRRRTPKTWSERPVTDEHVAAVHDAVRWGPTAMNASPMRLLLVRTPEARARLAAHMAPGNRDRVLGAPLAVVVAADTRFHEHLGHLAPHVGGARDRFDPDHDGRERMARENTWLQAGYLVVGLRAVGLDVGPMTGMDAAGVDADLLAGTGQRTVMVLNVGWPAEDATPHPRAPRLDFDVVARVI
ncbi:malonic semialdehyde reductase [Actinotalea sp. JY-7885]|uniref:malonic semialdehyde reductase n=1 Tax=Actinotalea sp. JY-7885 TaxID=2758576 RepID=UPI00165E7849|nr:malonic semialdehyde reductase [Actinotalea sp. JY-7885]